METKRATVPAAEEILGRYYRVLDHGFVSLVDYMGSDEAVEQAARVSYGAGTRKLSETRGLIRYLRRHRHTTPSEMVEFKFHCAMPMFVARQWIRHRTASLNELSARYSLMPLLFYRPPAEQFQLQSRSNKQGRAGDAPPEVYREAIERWEKLRSDASATYRWMLEEDVAREIARIDLPLSTYTQWYWKIDLHNLLHFLQLRADAHAQYEIRAYADELMRIVDGWVPLTTRAFRKYRVGGAQLSADALEAVRRRLRGESGRDAGLSAGEWRELVTLIPELALDSGHE
jgi:thymidylate synthase (FAD)